MKIFVKIAAVFLLLNSFVVAQTPLVVDVTVHGNKEFSSKEILKRMVLSPKFLKKSKFYETVLESDIQNIRQLYYNFGYLDVDIQSNVVTVEKGVRIDLEIIEGRQVTIETIHILGNVFFDDRTILHELNLDENDPLSKRKIENSIKKLVKFYGKNGFLNAEITPTITINEETFKAFVDIMISSQQQFAIGQLNINGLSKTKPWVVQAYCPFKKNDIIDSQKLLDFQKKLFMTGLFKSVFVELIDADSTTKDISVSVAENENTEYSLSVGYGAVDKARTRIEVSQKNLLGTGQKLGAATKLSYVKRNLEALFSSPMFLKTPWTLDMQVATEKSKEPAYTFYKNGGMTGLGRRINNSRILFKYELDQTKYENVKVATKFTDKPIRHVLSGTFVVDKRNNLINPTSGYYFDVKNEWASIMNAKVRFFRQSWQTRYFRPLTYSLVFASSVNFSYILTDDVENLPLKERFYVGGENTIRGFAYHKVGPLDAKRQPLGGDVRLVINVFELRKTVYKNFGAALFLDAGNVWRGFENIQLKDTRYSPGLGIRYKTPIGIARLDYGFNPSPQKGEDAGHWYFSIGHAF